MTEPYNLVQVRARPREADAIEFNGSNLADLRKLVPPEIATFDRVTGEASVLMTAPGRRPRVLQAGDWLIWDGQTAAVNSAIAFVAGWERL